MSPLNLVCAYKVSDRAYQASGWAFQGRTSCVFLKCMPMIQANLALSVFPAEENER